MGPGKQEEQVTLPPASGAEQKILQLLMGLGKGGIGQLGDLSGLARGDFSAFAPTAQDRALIGENLGYTRDIATRGMEDTLAELSAGLDEELTARGIAGASGEAVDRAILRRDAGRQVADMLDRSRMEGNQFLLNLPGQKAGLALSANQELFNRIIGSLGPALQGYQVPRLMQTKRTTTSTPGALDYFNSAAGLAGKFIKPGGGT